MPGEIEYTTPQEIDPQGRNFYVIGVGIDADEKVEETDVYIDAVYDGASAKNGQVWRVSSTNPTEFNQVSQILYRKMPDGSTVEEFTHPLTHDTSIFDPNTLISMPQSIVRLSELASTIAGKLETQDITYNQIREQGLLSDPDLRELLIG